MRKNDSKTSDHIASSSDDSDGDDIVSVVCVFAVFCSVACWDQVYRN